MTQTIAYILISVLTGSIGQILLKQGMTRIGSLTLTPDQLISILWSIATNLYVVGGLLVYGISVVFWLVALSRAELSYTYPFASLQYALMLIASWQLFDEQITPLRLLGTLVIGIGVFLVSRS
jgi:drug/metabolite transporter (DMT)-like permease